MSNYYKHLDPQRDFCEGETERVEMDPLRLLRDLSEAVYQIRRSMAMAGEDDAYRQLRERLERIEADLVAATNAYADGIRKDHLKVVIRWIEEVGDANYEFGQVEREEE